MQELQEYEVCKDIRPLLKRVQLKKGFRLNLSTSCRNDYLLMLRSVLMKEAEYFFFFLRLMTLDEMHSGDHVSRLQEFCLCIHILDLNPSQCPF